MGRLFQQVDVPGERDPSDHITMFYLGDGVPLDRLMKIIPILYKLCAKTDPFKVSCKRITTFPKGKKGWPVIGQVQSKEIQSLWTKIKSALEQNNIKYDKTYSEYNPHVTLSYSKKKPKNISFPKLEWTVGEISLYGGDEHDERLFVNFPFSIGLKEKKALDELDAMVKGYAGAVQQLQRR